MGRILLVDDEPTILAVVGTLLRAKGHDTVLESDGNKAAELIKAGGFELLISDVRMDPIDGIEFLRMAKEYHPEMSVIMLTAYYTDETFARLTKMGAFACLKKPFVMQELIDTASAAVDLTRKLREG